MSSEEKETLRVRHNGKTMNLLISNKQLNLKTLKKYYPLAAGLKYIHNNQETFISCINDSDVMQIIDLNSVHDVYVLQDDGDDLEWNIDDINVSFAQKATEYFYKDYTYNNICKVLREKYNMAVSLTTLKRFFKKMHLSRKNLKESSVEQIVTAIYLELEGSGFNRGYRNLWKLLQQEYGLTVKQSTINKILHIVDPAGISERKKNRLRRRTYQVDGPDYLWHIDGYDKIKRYGFAIHGCIDGFSKKIIWLNVATTNNDPKVIAYYFLQTINRCNYLPTIIRSDNGTENTIIENLQQCLRYHHRDSHAGESSFVTGKSTANQRIEAIWCQLRRQVIGFYINLFKAMEEKNLIDITNKLNIECLRYTYGFLIERDLYSFKEQWNAHHIRKQKSRNICGGKPNVMHELPELYEGHNCQKTVNKDHVNILMNKYASKPHLKSAKFSARVTELKINAEVPCTCEEALILYCDIMNALEPGRGYNSIF